MKLFNLLLAALVCSPLLAQNPAKLPSSMLIPKHELELRQHLAEQQLKSQPQSAMSQAGRKTTLFKAQSDDALILRDSTVSYLEDNRSLKTVYTYDESGRLISEVTYKYSKPNENGIIWEGEQSCRGWDGSSLRFSDTQGYLPSLSDETYEKMVGKTMHLDIKAVAGEGTTIRVADGWWGQYVPDTPVKAGDTFSFEFTEEMAVNMKYGSGGAGKDLVFMSNNGLTITKFYYDAETGVKEMLSTKKEHKYDAIGNYAGYIEYYWKNDDWVISYSDFKETLYDENGREIGFISPYLSAKYEYFTDTDGKEIGYIYYSLMDGEWIPQSKIEYTFDANGDITGGIVFSPKDGEWIVVSKFESAFDAAGREIVEIDYNLNDDEWVVYYKYEYAYDANGNEILNAGYNWKDGKWVASYKYEFAYDEHGNQTYNASSYELDGVWFNSFENKLEYTYDANDNIICQIQFQKSGGTWEEVVKNEYTYNANGNIISQLHFQKSGGMWEESSKYEYIYDANDNLSKCEYFVKTYNGWEQRKIDYYSDYHANSIEHVKAESRNASRKVIKHGKLFIMKGNRIYNIQGQKAEMK